MEKELAHYMKFDGLLPNNEPVAKNVVSDSEVEVNTVLLIYTHNYLHRSNFQNGYLSNSDFL